MTYDEKALLKALAAGDENAFNAIYNRYWEQLFFMAHKRLQSAQDAKEIIQNVFLTLWQKRRDLNIQSLPPYLAAMTRYAVYRHLSNEKRRASHLQVIQNRDADKVSAAIDLDNKQLLDIFINLSNELPEKYKIIFINHKLLDRPLEEVAEQLGISVRTAEGYVSKVMGIMRNYRRKLFVSATLLWIHKEITVFLRTDSSLVSLFKK